MTRKARQAEELESIDQNLTHILLCCLVSNTAMWTFPQSGTAFETQIKASKSTVWRSQQNSGYQCHDNCIFRSWTFGLAVSSKMYNTGINQLHWHFVKVARHEKHTEKYKFHVSIHICGIFPIPIIYKARLWKSMLFFFRDTKELQYFKEEAM